MVGRDKVFTISQTRFKCLFVRVHKNGHRDIYRMLPVIAKVLVYKSIDGLGFDISIIVRIGAQ
jgi:hypothetical protein